jgi:hypothetical protein
MPRQREPEEGNVSHRVGGRAVVSERPAHLVDQSRCWVTIPRNARSAPTTKINVAR